MKETYSVRVIKYESSETYIHVEAEDEDEAKQIAQTHTLNADLFCWDSIVEDFEVQEANLVGNEI